MAAKKVTRIVKGSKGIWINEGEGFVKKVEGDKIVLTPASAEAKSRYLYAPGEYEGVQKAKKMALEAAQAENDETAAAIDKTAEKPDPAKDKKPASKGVGSKGS